MHVHITNIECMHKDLNLFVDTVFEKSKKMLRKCKFYDKRKKYKNGKMRKKGAKERG